MTTNVDDAQVFVDDFLAHYGKKGMQWGKTTASVSGAASRGAQFTKTAVTKTASAVTSEKGIQRTKMAFKIGGQVGLTLSGLGLASIALSDPAVQATIKSGAQATKKLLDDFGSDTITKVKNIENPFKTTTTDRTGPSVLRAAPK